MKNWIAFFLTLAFVLPGASGQIIPGSIVACEGASVEISCDVDSVSWFMSFEGALIEASSYFPNASVFDGVLIIDSVPAGLAGDSLLAISTALADSGAVTCIQEITTFDPFETGWPTYTSGLPVLFCPGDSIVFEPIFPELFVDSVEWSVEGDIASMDGSILSVLSGDTVGILFAEELYVVATFSLPGFNCPSLVESDTLTFPPDLNEVLIEVSSEALCYENEGVVLSIAEPTPQQGIQLEWEHRLPDSTNWIGIGGGDSVVVDSMVAGLHEFRVVSSNGCDTLASTSAEVMVYSEFIAPTISTSWGALQSFCHESMLEPIGLSNTPVGGSGNYSIGWQATFEDGLSIASTDSPTFDIPFPVVSSFTVSLEVDDAFGCGSQQDSLYIEIYEPIAPAVIQLISSSVLCAENEGASVDLISSATGGGPEFSYTWMVENLGGSMDVESDGVSPLIINEFVESGQIFLLATNECGIDTSNAVYIEVLPPFVASGIAPNSDADFGVCYGTALSPFQLQAPPAGGVDNPELFWALLSGSAEDTLVTQAGGYSFAFEEFVFDDVVLHVNISDSFGCGSFVDFVEIEVFDDLQDADLALLTSDSLCASNEGIEVTIETMPSGGAPDSDFFWNVLTSEGLSAIESVAGEPLQLAQLDASAEVWLIRVNACGQTSSDTLSVTVLPPFSGVDVQPNSSTLDGICFGGPAEEFTWEGPATGASGNYHVLWSVFDQGGDLIATQLGGEAFNPFEGPVFADYTVSLEVEDVFGCGASESSLSVDVFNEIIAPTIFNASSDTLCAVNNGVEIDVTSGAFLGGGPAFDFTWHVANSSSTNIASDGTTSLVLDEVGEATQIWLEYANECGTSRSDTAALHVLDPLTNPEIEITSDVLPICFGQLGPALELVTLPTGGNNEWSYAWVQQIGFTQSTIATDPAVLQLTNQWESSSVSLLATSLYGCGQVNSNAIEIPVLDELMLGSDPLDQLICYGSTPEPVIFPQPSGGSGDFTFTWNVGTAQSSTQVQSVLPEIQLGALTDTTTLSLFVVDEYGCGSLESAGVEVAVLPQLEVPAIEEQLPDTICFQGSFDLNAVGFIEYPWLEFQWSLGLANFESIEGEFSPNVVVAGLEETAVVSFEITSSYGCGSVWSTPVTVPVFEPISPATISAVSPWEEGNSFCFGDELPAIDVDMPAQGGSEQYEVQWIVEGLNTNVEYSFPVDSDWASLNFGALSEDLAVSLEVQDVQGCGVVTSNELFASVYAELEWNVNLLPDTFCFGVPLEGVEAWASGGGDSFSYQWFGTAGGEGVVNVTENELANFIPDSSFEASVQATSLEGCGTLLSDTVSIQIHSPMSAGIIGTSMDSICVGEYVIVADIASPSGGNGAFVNTWLQLNSLGAFEPSGTMLPDIEVLGVEGGIIGFRESTNECGTVQTDTVSVVVHPNPSQPTLTGEMSPCVGSLDVSYAISNGWWQGLVYNWNIEGGTITSGETGPELLVDWDEEWGTWVLGIELTFPATGCSTSAQWDVTPSELAAPPPSEVVKKNGLDVLVSGDSTWCATYQWGRQNIETLEEEFFADQTAQYALFEPLDTLNYYYFVEVSYDCEGFGDCPTRNYYQYDPFVGLEEREHSVLVYPNPAAHLLFIDGVQGNIRVDVFDSSGRFVMSRQLQGNQLEIAHLPEGSYVLLLSDLRKAIPFLVSR